MRAKVATLAAFSLVLLAVAEFHAHAHPLAVLAPRKQPRKWRKIGASVAAAQRRHNHHQQRHLLAAVHDDEAHVALVLSIPQLEHSGKADSLQKQVEEALQPFIASHQASGSSLEQSFASPYRPAGALPNLARQGTQAYPGNSVTLSYSPQQQVQQLPC